jgi:hypothetical protein
VRASFLKEGSGVDRRASMSGDLCIEIKTRIRSLGSLKGGQENILSFPFSGLFCVSIDCMRGTSYSGSSPEPMTSSTSRFIALCNRYTYGSSIIEMSSFASMFSA